MNSILDFFLIVVLAVSLGFLIGQRFNSLYPPKAIKFFEWENAQQWVKLGDLAKYLRRDVKTLWKDGFSKWKNDSGYVAVAFKLGSGRFMGGITADGASYKGRYVLGSSLAFINNLQNVYITKEDAKVLM